MIEEAGRRRRNHLTRQLELAKTGNNDRVTERARGRIQELFYPKVQKPSHLSSKVRGVSSSGNTNFWSDRGETARIQRKLLEFDRHRATGERRPGPPGAGPTLERGASQEANRRTQHKPGEMRQRLGHVSIIWGPWSAWGSEKARVSASKELETQETQGAVKRTNAEKATEKDQTAQEPEDLPPEDEILFHNVEVEGCEVKTLMDTGASRSFIHPAMLGRIGARPKLLKKAYSFSGISGPPLETLYWVPRVKLKVGNWEGHHHLLVAALGHDLILGLDFWKHAGLTWNSATGEFGQATHPSGSVQTTAEEWTAKLNDLAPGPTSNLRLVENAGRQATWERGDPNRKKERQKAFRAKERRRAKFKVDNTEETSTGPADRSQDEQPQERIDESVRILQSCPDRHQIMLYF